MMYHVALLILSPSFYFSRAVTPNLKLKSKVNKEYRCVVITKSFKNKQVTALVVMTKRVESFEWRCFGIFV